MSNQVKSKVDSINKMFRFYNAAFVKFPDAEGLEYWIGKNQSGENRNCHVAAFFRF